MRTCPVCRGVVDEEHDFLAHVMSCQREQSERWQRAFDAGLRRLRERPEDDLNPAGRPLGYDPR